MTKKDFQVIAAVIAALPHVGELGNMYDPRNAVALAFADALAPLNPRFKRALFIQEATGQVAVTARKVREFSADERKQFRAALGDV